MSAQELRTKLSMIEPTESMYAGITDSDVPALQELLNDREEWMAARAAFALSRVGTRNAVAALAEAADDGRAQVRVAVAASVAQTPVTLPDGAAVTLLLDDDIGVRKFATLAIKSENGIEPRALLKRIASEDPTPVIRENAVATLLKIG